MPQQVQRTTRREASAESSQKHLEELAEKLKEWRRKYHKLALRTNRLSVVLKSSARRLNKVSKRVASPPKFRQSERGSAKQGICATRYCCPYNRLHVLYHSRSSRRRLYLTSTRAATYFYRFFPPDKGRENRE